jgi:Polyketide cyclase / dehydrase and lipid transport
MLRNILIAVAALVVVLLIIIAMRPPTYRVSRSATIAAPPAVVYAQIVDFHRWDGWSPWAKIDPSMKATYTGPASGPGAAYAWAGNDKVGEGKMLITGAKPNEEVNIKLDFLKPFQASALTGFALEPVGAGTKLTWSMSGENNFVMKAMSLFHDMDAEIGKDFDKGLTDLKSISEAEAKRLATEEMARKAAADAAAAQAAAAQAAADAAAAAAAAKPHKAHK